MTGREACNRVAAGLERARAEMLLSLAWYTYEVEVIRQRTGLSIDGDFATRRWWFVLRRIP